MLSNKMYYLVISTMILVLCFTTTVNATDDISKLVRIQKGDKWLYRENNGNVANFTVIGRYIDSHNHEMNILKTNSTVPFLAPFLSYQFTSNFSVEFTFHKFSLWTTSRGNFLARYNGTTTVDIIYNNFSFSFEHNGLIWSYPKYSSPKDTSHNMAIVTGEPQFVSYSFSHFAEKNITNFAEKNITKNEWYQIQLEINVRLRIIPSDPQTLTWNSISISAITLTEQIYKLDVLFRYTHSNGTIVEAKYYAKDINTNFVNKYQYVKSIGLPIKMIFREAKHSDISISKSLDQQQSMTPLPTNFELIKYSIKNAYLKIPIPKITKENNFSLIFSLTPLLLIKIKRRYHY